MQTPPLPKITRREIAAEMAVKIPGLTVLQAHAAINMTFDLITRAVLAGRDAEMRGFGRFRLSKYRTARRKPQSGSTAGLPRVEITTIRFRLSPLLMRKHDVSGTM